MAVQLSPFPKFEATDELGNPAAGARLWTYESGPGDTPLQVTFADYLGSFANPNPVVLDAAGRADVWLQENKLYKLVLENASGSVIWTADGIRGIGGGSGVEQELSQWLPATSNVTFRDGTSFDLPGDQRGEYHVGRRVRIIDGGGTLLGSIQSSAFTTLTTVTVGLDAGTIDVGLQSVSLAFIRADERAIDYAAIANTPVGGPTDPFPVGFCSFRMDDSIPAKWVEIGAEVPKSSYPELYALIGDTFSALAGDPANNFVTGDVAARSPVGRGASSTVTRPATFDSILPAVPPAGNAVAGGEGSHLPLESETAQHSHAGTNHTHDMGNHRHDFDHDHSVPSHSHSMTHTHSISHDHGIRSNTASNTTTGGNSNRWQSFGSVSNRTEGASPSTSGGSSSSTTGSGGSGDTGNASPDRTDGPNTNTTGSSGAGQTSTAGSGLPFNVYTPAFPVLWIIKALP